MWRLYQLPTAVSAAATAGPTGPTSFLPTYTPPGVSATFACRSTVSTATCAVPEPTDAPKHAW